MSKRIRSIELIERRVTAISQASKTSPRVILMNYPETFQEALERTCREYGCAPSQVGPVAVATTPCETDEEWLARHSPDSPEREAYDSWWESIWKETHPEE